MASLRLPCPWSFKFSLHNKPHTHNQFKTLSLHSSCSPLSLTLFPIAIKQPTTKPIDKFVLHFSATTQQDPVVDSVTEEEVVVEEKPQIEEQEFSKTRLIAQNVPWNATAEDVRSLFEKHGTVVDVELSMYSKTLNRGLAFIEMASPEEALAAFNDLQSHEYEGRTLRINYAKPKKKKTYPVRQSKPGPKFNLFVANLSFKVRSNDLRDFFTSEGSEILSTEVIFHDNPRKSTGYGFVSFRTKKQADEALAAFDGKELMGRPLRVARSRQFVKERTEEDLQSSNSMSTELNSSSDQSDTADVEDQSDTAEVN